MTLFRLLGPIAVGASLLAGGPAQAQVYKWVDEKGVVNYTTSPPPKGRTATRLNEDEGRVSTIPHTPVAAPDGDPRERALQERTLELERSAEAQRQATAANELQAQEAYRQWLQQCRAERRADCDAPYSSSYFDPGFGYVYPPLPRPRPLIRQPAPGTYQPTPGIVQGGGGVTGPYYRPPAGGIAAGPGPAGIGGGYSPASPGGVVVGPGPGGVGAQYYPVPPGSAPAVPAPRPAPRGGGQMQQLP